MPWFLTPVLGGQNCLSVVQALQAELGNLMAVRQNLCVQIGVCWLQCLIELAGKELVIFRFDFQWHVQGPAAVLLIPPA